VYCQSQIQYTYDAAGNLVQVTRITKPDLVISNLAVGLIGQHPGGGYDITASFTVSNAGNAPAIATWYDRGYISTDAVLDNGDQLLSANNVRTVNLLPNAAYTASVTFTSTAGTPAGAAYLIIKTDGGDAASGQYSATGANYVDESNEANNAQAVAITLPTQKPDLVITNATVNAIVVNQNGSYSIPVTFTVTNSGGVAAPASWYDLAYLSTDSALDNLDVNFGWTNRGATLAPLASYTVTATYTTATGTAAGAYTLFMKADGSGSMVGGTNMDAGRVAEASESNNAYAVPITLPARPDLQVTSASIGAVGVNQNGSYSVPITYTVTNAGASAAQPSWYDLAYLSTDATLDNSDLNFGWTSHATSLAPGASYTTTATYTIPTSVAAGTYTLFKKADGSGSMVGGTNTDAGRVAEADETNNALALPLTLPARPDLQLTSGSVGTIVKNGNGSYSIPVTFTVTNAGASAAMASWYDLAYLSVDSTLDNADTNFGWSSRATALAAGGTYTTTITFTTSTTVTAGAYTLFLKTDGSGAMVGGSNTDNGRVAEANEANNTSAVSVTLP
jgi:hypothetical protein